MLAYFFSKDLYLLLRIQIAHSRSQYSTHHCHPCEMCVTNFCPFHLQAHHMPWLDSIPTYEYPLHWSRDNLIIRYPSTPSHTMIAPCSGKHPSHIHHPTDIPLTDVSIEFSCFSKHISISMTLLTSHCPMSRSK
jgi:hypothetical protein